MEGHTYRASFLCWHLHSGSSGDGMDDKEIKSNTRRATSRCRHQDSENLAVWSKSDLRPYTQRVTSIVKPVWLQGLCTVKQCHVVTLLSLAQELCRKNLLPLCQMATSWEVVASLLHVGVTGKNDGACILSNLLQMQLWKEAVFNLSTVVTDGSEACAAWTCIAGIHFFRRRGGKNTWRNQSFGCWASFDLRITTNRGQVSTRPCHQSQLQPWRTGTGRWRRPSFPCRSCPSRLAIRRPRRRRRWPRRTGHPSGTKGRGRLRWAPM